MMKKSKKISKKREVKAEERKKEELDTLSKRYVNFFIKVI